MGSRVFEATGLTALARPSRLLRQRSGLLQATPTPVCCFFGLATPSGWGLALQLHPGARTYGTRVAHVEPLAKRARLRNGRTDRRRGDRRRARCSRYA